MLRALSRTNVRFLLLRTSAVTCIAKTQSPYRNRLLKINQEFASNRCTSAYNPLKGHSTTFNIDDTSGTLDIVFDDQSRSRYPFVWLRDNCPCDDCFDKSSLQRKIIFETFDVDVAPTEAAVDSAGQTMTIHWTDGHVSEYQTDWLKNYKFPQVTDHIQEMALKYWGSEMSKDKLQTFSYVDIMNDDSVLYSWLVSLHTDGICLVKDMGLEEGSAWGLAERVAYPRATCYGIDWQVKSKPDPCNLAYTGCRLCLHTDLPFYMYEPCIQVLHGIKVSEFGGESEFVDGFKVAYDLKRDDSGTFKILSTIPIGFADQGVDEVSKSEYYLKHSKPVISFDSNGKINKISFNQHIRGIRTSVSVDDMKSVYRALQIFNSALYKKENLVSFKIQQGEAVCFNNIRTLHGRSEFLIPAGNQVPRHLHGNYIDWDTVYSRIRVIAKNQNIFF